MDILKNTIAMMALSFAVCGVADAATLIDGTTKGLYNEGIGTRLNGTNPITNADGEDGLLFGFSPESGFRADVPSDYNIDLSAAAAQLGDWLSDPTNPGGTWSAGFVDIPTTWARHTETAIIYAFDAGVTGLSNVIASFGVDNGLYAWLNGVFIGGGVAPGGTGRGDELVLNLGDLDAGWNYLQIMRTDHGGSTGYKVSVTGDFVEPAPVPLPASGLLLLAGAAALGTMRRRKAI